MQLDLQGRVSNINLPNSRALLPLFEAIINSLQSIEDVQDLDKTYIKIIVERDDSQSTLNVEEKNPEPINSFIIEDNGIGFNSINYRSFETSDSLLKKERGGKGIGRFLWLKAFNNVTVESVFNENGEFFERNFRFSLIDDGVGETTLRTIKDKERKTIVRLNQFNVRYREVCPKKLDTIALRIVEHCLVFFLLSKCPRITLSDNHEMIDLNQLFLEQIKSNSELDLINLKGNTFELVHLRLYSGEETTHKIHYCANQREVFNRNLSIRIPNLNKKIKDDEGKSFLYVAYLSGDYLDKKVNSERTGFNIEEDSDIEFPDYVTLKELESNAIHNIKEYLNTFLEPIRREKIESITKYIHEKSPQYRPILKYKEDALEEISPGLSEDNLDLELYKITQEFDYQLKKKGTEYLKKDLNDIRNLQEYKDEYLKFIEQVNDLGKSNLAKYIIHRKLILDLLENNLQKNYEENYKLEESVHELIFPLRTTSDDIYYENQNLWIIDERLAYHYYLASDIRFNQLQAVAIDDLKRSDLIIFNQPLAFVGEEQPYRSIVIVEFKRPGRKHYNEEDNPIGQVLTYIRKIREGKKNDRKGRPIDLQGNLPFYSYVICDINKKIQDIAEDYNLLKTHDGMGYFGYNKNLDTYIELISYDKLLIDARKRNKILFDKLFSSGIHN